MLNYKIQEWLSWPLIRAHLCTLAVSVSLHATWRGPRDAFRFGGLAYGVVLTCALLIVALPVTLLQLSIGQLSQQDAVGVWRAVPFFRGIGYLRIIISFVSSAYSLIYVSICIAYFLYTASNSIPFADCIEWIVIEDVVFESPVNASECLRNTFMSPVNKSPEYYMAIAFLLIVLWIAGPFVFYNPVKLMKRLLYGLAPLVIILGIVVLSCIGNASNLSSFVNKSDWDYYLEPNIWHSGVVQALWSSQVAGGYLIAAGDSVYSNTNVQWTSLLVIGTNIISSWCWLLFWFAISGTGEKDQSALAVLVQTYQVAVDEDLGQGWPLMVFAILILSGFIVMLSLLYPIYERLRRIGGVKWRLVSAACSVVGAGVSLAILAGRLPALTLVEDIAVPSLICIATVLEILAFGFIYGWRTLIEDVEFLTGNELQKYWVWGWWVSPGIIAPLTVWWAVYIFLLDSEWSAPAWQALTFLVSAAVAGAVVLLCAGVAVCRQVQYDILSKLRSSFQPSRHWGPRDPITHYYWLARRDEERGDMPRTRYSRRELGQLSRRPSFLTVSESVQLKDNQLEVKKRSNSDDWLYTSGRKKCLAQLYQYVDERKRSKSLDWEVTIKMKGSDIIKLSMDNYLCDVEKNNNVGYIKNVSKYK